MRTARLMIPIMALTMLMYSSICAQSFSDFMGIKFGTKYSEAKAEILKRAGATFSEEASTSEDVFVQGVKWGDYEDCSITLSCDKVYGMYRAEVWVSTSLNNDNFDYDNGFERIVQILSRKYGKSHRLQLHQVIFQTLNKNHTYMDIEVKVNDVGIIIVKYEDEKRCDNINKRLQPSSPDY